MLLVHNYAYDKKNLYMNFDQTMISIGKLVVSVS